MKNLTKDEKREIATMYADKSIKVQEIAELYGTDRSTIAKIATDNGAIPRKIVNSGSKINDMMVQEIIKDYSNDIRVADIAEKYGVSHSTISRIAKRNNLALRHNRDRRTDDEKYCSHCRRLIPQLNNISFCPYCGKDIRTEEQLLIEDLKNSLGIIATSQMNSSSKDKIRDSILEAIKWIKAHS